MSLSNNQHCISNTCTIKMILIPCLYCAYTYTYTWFYAQYRWKLSCISCHRDAWTIPRAVPRTREQYNWTYIQIQLCTARDRYILVLGIDISVLDKVSSGLILNISNLSVLSLSSFLGVHLDWASIEARERTLRVEELCFSFPWLRVNTWTRAMF